LHEYTADVLFRLGFGQKESREYIQKFIPYILALSNLPISWHQRASWIVPQFYLFFKPMQIIEMLINNMPMVKFIHKLQGTLKTLKQEKVGAGVLSRNLHF
jgi:hypothetical protein